jgi:FkbM family methyltransferase
MFRKYLYQLLGPLVSRDAAKKGTFFKWCRKWFGYAFIPSKTSVQGSIMYLHKAGHSFELAFEGGYEPLETRFLKSLNLEGRVAADIGACIGYYSLLLSKQVGGAGQVFAFEPEARNYLLLEKNIAANKARNVTAVQTAVGDNNGETYLHISTSPGQHQVADNPFGAERVPIVSFDEFIKNRKVPYEKLAYVKIDVEGNEYEVLNGMRAIIQHSNDLVIQFEYAPQHLEERGCNFVELFTFIDQNNLDVYYWVLATGKLKQCKDVRWFLEDSVVQEFKKGVIYSRNLILTKRGSKFDFVGAERIR